MPQPSVKMDQIVPERPVSEMTEAEKEAFRKQVQEKLLSKAGEVAQGNKLTVDIEVNLPPYVGTITMKRPSLDEERQIGVRVAKYLQGAVGVDVKTENLAIFFSTFDVCVIWESAPEWFKPREMHDYDLLNFIYGRFANWLATFRSVVPREPQGSSEAPAK